MYRNPSGCHVWCTLHHSQSGTSRLSREWCKDKNFILYNFWKEYVGTSRDLSLHLRHQF
jgi:hypothetical protein